MTQTTLSVRTRVLYERNVYWTISVSGLPKGLGERILILRLTGQEKGENAKGGTPIYKLYRYVPL